MNAPDILALPSMPLASSSYEFICMPNSAGFGDHTKLGMVIPAQMGGEPVNFTAQMSLDDEPPIAGGREVRGSPKLHAHPKLANAHDTLTGTLECTGIQVAVGTMGYKHQHLLDDVQGRKSCSSASIIGKMGQTQVNLKLIPDVDVILTLAQLVADSLVDIQVHGAWSGPARLHLVPHVNAPVTDLLARGVFGGLYFIANLTLPYARVLHDHRKVAEGAQA